MGLVPLAPYQTNEQSLPNNAYTLSEFVVMKRNDRHLPRAQTISETVPVALHTDFGHVIGAAT